MARVLIPTERLLGEGRGGWVARVEEAKLKARSLYDRLRELPTLQDLCLASELPLDGLQPDTEFFEPAAGVGRPSQRGHVHWVSPGCFAALGIPLLSGRDFAPNDGLDPRRCIVNRAFAREVLGMEDAVGEQRLRVARPPEPGPTPPPATTCEVIGVVGDVMEDDLVRGTAPAVYLPFFAQPAQHGNEVSLMFAVAMRSAGALDLISSALPEAVDELFPNSVVFDVQTLQSSVEDTFQARTALERILVAFGLSALGLAAIGLFGVTAYTVAERSAEIGIRRALGASRRQILLMVLGETAAVVGVGALFGLGLSRLVRSFVESVLYGVTALDPLTHAAVFLGIFVTALGAALIPARAAAVISPSRALTRL